MNDLATYNNTNNTNAALTTPKASNNIFENDLTGLGDLGIGSPGNLIIVQNTTRDPMGAKPGQILDTKTGTIYDEITLVPLHSARTRVMFPDELGADPLCRSDNGVFPSPYLNNPPMSSNCGDCRFSKWVDRVKPKCSERWRLMVIEESGVIPLYLTVGGSGFGLCRDMLQGIKQHIVEQYSKTGQRYDLYDYKFTFRSDRASSQRGVFYTPRFSGVTRLSPAGKYQEQFETFVVNGMLKAQRHEYQDQMVAEILPAAAVLPTADPVPQASI